MNDDLAKIIVEMLGKLLAPLGWINGAKTYIGAAGFGLVALYYIVTLQPVSAMEALSLFMTIVGLRHAVAKATPPAEAPYVLPFDDQDLDEPRA